MRGSKIRRLGRMVHAVFYHEVHVQFSGRAYGHIRDHLMASDVVRVLTHYVVLPENLAKLPDEGSGPFGYLLNLGPINVIRKDSIDPNFIFVSCIRGEPSSLRESEARYPA